jgi:hypothetical protein
MSDDEDNIYHSPINSLHSNAFDPGQLDYRQMIALRGAKGGYDYSRYRQFYKGGADPVESRSSAQDQAIENEWQQINNIEDEDVAPESLTVPNELVPIDKEIVFQEIAQMYESLTGPSYDSQVSRDTIFENTGFILNQTNFLLQGINGAMKSKFNVEHNYSFNDFSDFILGVNFDELRQALTNEINDVYDKVLKRKSAASRISKTNLIYIMLSITGPLGRQEREQVTKDTQYYEMALFNTSFTILNLAANAPKSVNNYGDAKANAAETDTSAIDDIPQIPKIPPPPKILQKDISVEDRVRILLEIVNSNLGYTEKNINEAMKIPANYTDLRNIYATNITDKIDKNIKTDKNKPEGERYEYFNIDNKIANLEDARNTIKTSIQNILKVKGAVKSLVNKTLLKSKKKVGRPRKDASPKNERIDDKIDPETAKAILDNVAAERERQAEKAKIENEAIKANPNIVKYTPVEPINKNPPKLDMSKFSAIASILSPKEDKARERNTEVMPKLSADKQANKALLETLFANKQPLKETNPELTEVIKIPKAPPLTIPQLTQATQATSSRVAALVNSSGYQQTPKDSLITTMTVIKLLQPIIKDSDVSTRLAAAEALLMAKAYDNNSMNAIDNYLKRAIDDKLNVLKGYSSAYTNAESDLLEAMKQVLDNKNNPDNPSKLFRYSTYMKSNKSVPVTTKTSVKGKVDYLKSIDQGVKSLNLKKKTATKTATKTPVTKPTIRDVHSKKSPVTKPTSKKVIKTNIQKQKERTARVKAALSRLRGRQTLDSGDTDADSEAYINKLSAEAKLEAERAKQQATTE